MVANFKKSHFGIRVREKRILMGLARHNLSDMLGVALSTLQLWENGEREPPVSKLVDLANILGTSTNYLLFGGTNEQTMSSVQTHKPTIKEALEILEQAINSQGKVVGLELTDSELKLVKNYRSCDEIEKGKVEAITEAFASLHNDKEHEKSKAKDVA